MAKRLEARVAIVTGGNSGIGEATAHLFAQEGAKVALMARREAEGEVVQDAIRSVGGEAKFIACDVSDRKVVDAAVEEAVATYGGINVLFNNAGGGSGQNFPNEDDENWDTVIRVNLTGTFYMSRAVWPHLLAAGGGAIVNMSSLAATAGFNKNLLDLAGGATGASYYAAKAVWVEQPGPGWAFSAAPASWGCKTGVEGGERRPTERLQSVSKES